MWTSHSRAQTEGEGCTGCQHCPGQRTVQCHPFNSWRIRERRGCYRAMRQKKQRSSDRQKNRQQNKTQQDTRAREQKTTVQHVRGRGDEKSYTQTETFMHTNTLSGAESHSKQVLACTHTHTHFFRYSSAQAIDACASQQRHGKQAWEAQVSIMKSAHWRKTDRKHSVWKAV